MTEEATPPSVVTPLAAPDATPTRAEPARTIVVFSIDTLRSDRLPAYGYQGGATPAIDTLVRDSILFRRAYSPVPLTLPAHASLFTGALPRTHGVRDNSGYRLGDHEVTLAERLQAAGYRTLGAVSSFVLRKDTGIAQGFDWYDDQVDLTSRSAAAASSRPGAQTLSSALQQLRALEPGDPAFLFIHIYEPHAPYTPPPPFDTGFDDPYDGEIAESDRLVGLVTAALKEVNRYQDSAIVVLSDHGENLGEHGEDQHGVLLTRAALQIPLILKLPGAARAAETVEVPVHLTDLHPTILGLAGLSPDLATGTAPTDHARPETERRRTSPPQSLLQPERSLRERPLFAETAYPELRLGWHSLRSVIDGAHHYVEGVYGELFELTEDPAELEDLADQERARVRQSQALLEQYPLDLVRPEGRIAAEDAARLSQLGYLVGGSTLGSANKDPRDQIGAVTDYQRAYDLVAEGKREQALEALEKLVDEQPSFVDAWQLLGLIADELGRQQQAYDAFRQAFDLTSGSRVLLSSLGRLALSLGKTEEAATLLEQAVRHEPTSVESRARWTQSLLALDRLDEALRIAQANRRALPESVDLTYQVGLVHLQRRDFRQAEASFREALAQQPQYVPAMIDLGVVLALQQRYALAERVLLEAQNLRPRDAQIAESLRFVRQRLAESAGSSSPTP